VCDGFCSDCTHGRSRYRTSVHLHRHIPIHHVGRGDRLASPGFRDQTRRWVTRLVEIRDSNMLHGEDGNEEVRLRPIAVAQARYKWTDHCILRCCRHFSGFPGLMTMAITWMSLPSPKPQLFSYLAVNLLLLFVRRAHVATTFGRVSSSLECGLTEGDN
jgi:hypothetical protein